MVQFWSMTIEGLSDQDKEDGFHCRLERERWFSHYDTDKCDDQKLDTFLVHTRPHQLFIVHLMNLLLFHSLLNFPKEALKAIAR